MWDDGRMPPLPALAWAIPGDLDTPTGGYAYDRRVMEALRDGGREIRVAHLGDSFPQPTAADLADVSRQLGTVPPSTIVIIDGLAFGALDTATLESVSAPIIALVHHPLAFEGDLAEGRREKLMLSERENLARASAIIVTSPSTGRLLVDEYGVEPERITVAEPGTDQPRLPHQPATPPLILSVGSQSPRKGHDVLLEALGQARDLPWRAVIVGSARDESYAQQLLSLCETLGLNDRVTLTGVLDTDELDKLYSQATVFALATRFEGYGMVFAEAMAHGLPIVSCNAGAVADTVAEGAGLLTTPNDPGAFSAALRSVLSNNTLRQSMTDASLTAGEQLPSWKHTAKIVASVADRLETQRDD